jgi:hypothetical protein
MNAKYTEPDYRMLIFVLTCGIQLLRILGEPTSNLDYDEIINWVFLACNFGRVDVVRYIVGLLRYVEG